MDAPVPIIASNPSDSAPSQSSVPSRPMFVGAVGAVATWGIVFVAGRYGIPLPDYVQAAVPVIIGFVVAYLVPPTVRDVANRLNDKIVAFAAADQNIPVSDHTMVLPEGTKVVSLTTTGRTVATPPAMGPPPVLKTPEAEAQMPKGH
jgi:hypothetical protein